MACIRPFPALRPKPELASKVCELPYDVMSSSEARELASNNPLSFLHVSKPEIDLDPSMDLYDPQVYAKGRENFQKLISSGTLFQETQPSFYLYRQIMGTHSQIGVVAAASCDEYERSIIKKHEFTRPDKEDDRVRHIETLNSQTGPVFLTYRSNATIDSFIKSKSSLNPTVDFTAADGVRHTAWVIADPKDISTLREEFSKIPYLYIADGHHRSAAAMRVWKKRSGKSESASAFFLSVIFPHHQMQILSYNRLVKDLNGLELDHFIQRLRELGTLELKPQQLPVQKHEICIFLNNSWHTFRWKPELIAQENVVGQLDVSLLQKHVLAPLLGIDDPRTSKRIHFVGGIRGTKELEEQVRNGQWTVAFSMFPTKIDDLMKIADEGDIMPPKSTWFEPKLRDAMFCHMLE
jgi:uncharacterized protein (DUF1015 family)